MDDVKRDEKKPMGLDAGPVGVFCHRFAFGPEAEDINGHVNNVEYIRKMQEVSILHVERNGWPVERLLEHHWTWVVRQHTIEYLKPCHAGESLLLYTWVHEFHRIRSARRYRFVRESDGAVLARAETDWIFLDVERGRPVAIPEEICAAFPLTGDAAEAEIGK